MNISLPSQMQQLLRELNLEIIIPTRAAIKNATNHRQNEISQIETSEEKYSSEFSVARKTVEERGEQEKSQIEQKTGTIIRKAESLLSRSQSLRNNTQAHLKRNHVGVPENSLMLSHVPKQHNNNLLQKAEQEIARADDIFRLMEKTKVSGEVFAFKGLGCLFFSVAFVAAIYISASSRSGIMGFFIWLAVIYGGTGLLQLLYKMGMIKAQSSNIHDILKFVDADLNYELQRLRSEHETQLQGINDRLNYDIREMLNRQEQIKAEHDQKREAIHQQYYQKLQVCEAQLTKNAKFAHQQCESFRKGTGYISTYWNDPAWKEWTPVASPAFVASFGTLIPDTTELKTIFPSLNLDFPIPALIPFADGKCLLLKATGEATAQAAQCLQSVMLRLLATIPPGKVNFTLIDPVGLGKNVAVMMKLAEYEESLIKSRAWTEPQHIEQRLAELTEHMETVIQKYLRTDFASIEEYNEKAGEVAEPYRVLVVMDFPVNFTDTAARRLISIAQSGPRCGVYTLIMMNTNKPLPHGFTLSELEQHSFVINRAGNSFIWEDPEFKSCHLSLATPPADNFGNQIIEKVGQHAKEAMKVEVPYTKLLAQAGLGNEQWWKGTTARKMEVPLGPTGARKQQFLNFGEGLSHHGLIVGRPGSGKTNLMHVIITTLALAYSPDELQVYLVDFKKGVGFKPYADYKLPHAIAIAIESEREFGLSVLQGLDAEMQRRGEMFRAVSVEDTKSYREKTGEQLPRLLLVADEYQEFFTHNDNIRTQAELLLDRLTRQGRAFGIHILLGTQTLQGQNSMPKSIMNQIAVRIALQCSEEDSRIVLSHDNPAARLLSRPGEAIYNAANGLVEGNNLFQVALFTDDDRTQHLKAIAALADGNARRPIIFEGNEPARPETARGLNDLLNQPAPAIKPKAADAWLGEPTAIRPPLRARLRRQGGNNLLIVSRDEAEGLGMVFSTLLSLAAQHAPGQAEFYLVNLATADSDWFEWPSQLAEMLPHKVQVTGSKQTPDLIKSIMDETNRRVNASVGDAPSIYLMILGLQRARDLREEERDIFAQDTGVNANKLFASLVREGPEVGVHTIAWCDSLANVNRVARRQLREFGLRVASAMSADDSRALLDDGAASKLDKPHRAIFYDDERPGVFEKFRPYGLPDFAWLQQTAARLRNRA